MDIATSALAAASQQVLPATAAVTAPNTPDRLATERFAALMQEPVNEPSAAPSAANIPSAATEATSALPSSASTPAAVGDRILTGMQNVSGEFQTAWKDVAASLAPDQNVSMQDMLRLQLQLVQISVQYDLVGKAISRSTQNFDQLVRIQ